MRLNQVELHVTRFGSEVPEDYPKTEQTIAVYSDSNNLYEALAAAFAGVLEQVRKYEQIPALGCCDVKDNSCEE